MNLCELNVILGYTILILSQRDTELEVVAHTLNPSYWESHVFNSNTGGVETGKDMAGWREESKIGKGKSSWDSV